MYKQRIGCCTGNTIFIIYYFTKEWKFNNGILFMSEGNSEMGAELGF